jgi:hypothetical protein
MSVSQKRVLCRFAVAWCSVVACAAVAVLGIASTMQPAAVLAQEADEAVITIKTGERVQTIKFTKEELDNRELDSLVKKRVLGDPTKMGMGCKNPKQISDDCWFCEGGKVICTKNAKLRTVLAAVLRRE